MTSSRPVETQIKNAAEKITKALGEYFRKNVLASCKKVRDADESWFDDMLSGVIHDFQVECSKQVHSVLDDYSVSEKAELIKQANEQLQVSRPWHPSGDPEKDIRAHLLKQNLNHVEKISQVVLNLHRQLRPKLTELRAKRRQVQDEYTQLQLLARQLEEVS
ncbi:hypothetical protein D915_005494 [Fasciola hepatica]|uniref:Uncharacterized protein n=1 Tax=Fasciola hepatica TaxID=6192 RepID=A0A2H1CAK1_FASHE|nr:hypothetical protein D915_005494 [Fasciola hepatica]